MSLVNLNGLFGAQNVQNTKPQASPKPTFTPAPSVETVGSVACSAPASAPSCSFSAVC